MDHTDTAQGGVGLNGVDLLAIAHTIDPRVSERTIEYWCQERLLPRPSRLGQDGRRPLWTFPPGSDSQLRALLVFRQRTRSLNLLRMGLWAQGFDIPLTDVRSAMVSELGSFLKKFDDLLPSESSASVEERHEAALEKLAHWLATRRGPNLPRGSRQSLAERRQGFRLMLQMFFGDNLPADTLASDAHALERATGLSRGRKRVTQQIGPWLDGPPEDVVGFADVGNIHRLLTVAREATDEDLLMSRHLSQFVLSALAMLSTLADAMAGSTNSTGLDLLTELSTNDDPLLQGLLPLMFASFVRSPLREGLMQQLEPIGRMNKTRQQFDAFKALPPEEQILRLSRLSQDQRQWVDRLLLHEAPDR